MEADPKVGEKRDKTLDEYAFLRSLNPILEFGARQQVSDHKIRYVVVVRSNMCYANLHFFLQKNILIFSLFVILAISDIPNDLLSISAKEKKKRIKKTQITIR